MIVDDNTKEKGGVEDEDDVSHQQTGVPADVPEKSSNIETRSLNSKDTSINKGSSIRAQKDHIFTKSCEI